MVEDPQNMPASEPQSALRRLGLTLYQAKAYEVLCEHKVLTADEVSAQTGVPRSKVYDTLSHLVKHGWVERIEGRPLRFTSLDPREVISAAREDILRDISSVRNSLGESWDRRGVDDEEPLKLLKGLNAVIIAGRQLVRQAETSIFLMVRHLPVEEATMIIERLEQAKERGVIIGAVLHPNALTELASKQAEQLRSVFDEVMVAPIPVKGVVVDESELLLGFPKIEDGEMDKRRIQAIRSSEPWMAKSLVSSLRETWRRK